MSFLTGFEAQPNFPKEDLTDNNAAMLELMLSNREMSEDLHVFSEKTILLYRVGHKVINHITEKSLDQSNLMRAVSHGTAVYESISAMVTASKDITPRKIQIIESLITVLGDEKPMELVVYQQEATATFCTELENTKDVITTASARLFPHPTDYAVLGAAMARQFELDCHDAEFIIPQE